jgi:protein arginine N-methyltransferase 2
MEGASFDEVKELVDNGAPLWYQDEEGSTPLHAASFRDDEALLEYLLEKGAVWNAGMSDNSLPKAHRD